MCVWVCGCECVSVCVCVCVSVGAYVEWQFVSGIKAMRVITLAQETSDKASEELSQEQIGYL